MGFSEINRIAAGACLEKNIPFALYIMPGLDMESACFIASRPDEADDFRSIWPGNDSAWNGFFINHFGNDEEYTAGIKADMDAAGALELTRQLDSAYPPAWPELQHTPTDRLKYIAIISRVIARLKRDGGKTVMSRIECVGAEGGTNEFLIAAERYFSGFDDCFRYICYTRETGLWFGATPEIIARINGDEVRTMALAGTKRSDDATPWDSKNRKEHKMVVDYIVECLFYAGAQRVESAPTGEMGYSDIKHLVTPIRATLRIDDYRRFLTRMSPTPAVGGLPRDRALSEIFINEAHDRRCYGGFVGVKNGDSLDAFANLRCAMAEMYPEEGTIGFNIFSGGGITAGSKPDDEWNEAVSKVARLNDAIASLGN